MNDLAGKYLFFPLNLFLSGSEHCRISSAPIYGSCFHWLVSVFFRDKNERFPAWCALIFTRMFDFNANQCSLVYVYK